MPLILVREFWNLVIEKSVKSQGILLFMICGNPVKVLWLTASDTLAHKLKIIDHSFATKKKVSRAWGIAGILLTFHFPKPGFMPNTPAPHPTPSHITTLSL